MRFAQVGFSVKEVAVVATRHALFFSSFSFARRPPLQDNEVPVFVVLRHADVAMAPHMAVGVGMKGEDEQQAAQGYRNQKRT
jgi:hypothetical protein